MKNDELRLLYQDAQLLIVHKPAGWTIYAEDGVPKENNLIAVCQDLFGQKLFPVHRLDRATCGIVMFATDGRWAREMQQQFAGRKVEKSYLALLQGAVSRSQKINIPLKEKGRGQLSALTFVNFRQRGSLCNNEVSFVDLSPKTGRYHQLRKHCKLISHPIIGDATYGGLRFRSPGDKRAIRLMLSAVGLVFLHPRTGRQIRISDKPDFSFQDILVEAGVQLE